MSDSEAKSIEELRTNIQEYLKEKRDYDNGLTTIIPIGPLMTAETMLEIIDICVDAKASMA